MGAFLTATVVVVAIVTKFTEGAWIVVLAIPALMFAFHRVRAHYISVAKNTSSKAITPEMGREYHNAPIPAVARTTKMASVP